MENSFNGRKYKNNSFNLPLAYRISDATMVVLSTYACIFTATRTQEAECQYLIEKKKRFNSITITCVFFAEPFVQANQ